MVKEEKKLDNPVWYSLAEKHQDFAIKYGGVEFYQPEFCPFGGFISLDETFNSLDRYSELINNFYVVGDKPNFSSRLILTKNLICNQMILDTSINIEISENIIVLQKKHEDDLFALINLVQPGYFKKKTSQLGSYFGIFRNGKLIAVAGERMKMNSFTEISAVVTHPDHTGKGYAKQLVAYTANKILNENKLPYLHVVETNTVPIRLYEKLGFRTRRKISFWNLKTG